MKEIWRPIKEYLDLYEVSNWGRVRSLDRYMNQVGGGKQFRKGKILKPLNYRGNGYLCVQLMNNSSHKLVYIHRLVAEAFIPNPDSLPCVNHKDENKENNRVENLEWCTHSYNNTYGTAKERGDKKKSKKTYQYTLDGELVCEYSSVAEVQKLKGWLSGNIASACTGKLKTAYGYIWSHSPNLQV